MLIGEPFQFAVLAETVKEWNIDETFCNGILLFFVDGFILPGKELANITLTCAIHEMKEKMQGVPVNRDLYHTAKEIAFAKIYDMVYDEEDGRYELSPQEIGDKNCFVFAVSDGDSVRILAAELSYAKVHSRHETQNVIVREAVVSGEKWGTIISGLSSAVGSNSA